MPQFTIRMQKCCFVNDVVFIIEVEPVNLKPKRHKISQWPHWLKDFTHQLII